MAKDKILKINNVYCQFCDKQQKKRNTWYDKKRKKYYQVCDECYENICQVK